MIRRAPFDIYVAACDRKGGIYHFKTDFFGDGLPLKLYSYTPLDRPMFLTFEGNKLHAVLRAPFWDSPNSGVMSFDIAEDGKLYNPSRLTQTGGVVGCHLSAVGGRVYVANYVSGSVFATPNTLVTHQGSSVHPTRQTSAHTHFVSPTPDGKYMFAVDLGMDKIIVYDMNLNKVSEASVPAGNGARHVVFDAWGKYAYCVCELSSSVSIFTYEDGKFTFVRDVPALPENFHGESTAAAIRYYKGYLLVSHRGADCISFFLARGERLVRVQDFPCGGHSPRDFDLFDNHIIVTNESGDVCVLRPDQREFYKEVLDLRYMKNPLCVIGR